MVSNRSRTQNPEILTFDLIEIPESRDSDLSILGFGSKTQESRDLDLRSVDLDLGTLDLDPRSEVSRGVPNDMFLGVQIACRAAKKAGFRPF